MTRGKTRGMRAPGASRDWTSPSPSVRVADNREPSLAIHQRFSEWAKTRKRRWR